jgi:asparagine synthase (glutamine-hydrolysing)
MPGIIGLITKMPREWAEPQLLRMVEALRHESFYVTGTWIDESLGVYVGWVARKESFSDGMPIRNERQDVVIAFSGEEYPEPETRQRLKRQGHDFEAKGPAYLVHLYEEDPAFPRNLNGRFHGLVADRARGTATLFNDRYGLQRIYFHEARDAFYFSAEAKAILAVRPELRSADPRGLGEFIACGCVLENRTLFSGIHVLPPGSAWHFRNGALEKKAAYFEPSEWEQQEPLEREAYYNQLRDAFTTSLPRYFNGKERIGVSLTGGLDTRIILAWHNPAPGSMPCYTFGSMFHENQDVRVARRIAAMCGQSYEVITVGNEFLSQFAHYAERTIYITDACVDLSRSPDLYVNEKARDIAPVRMVGTYGSEMLLHAVMFKPSEPADGVFQPEVLKQVHAGHETYDAIRRTHPVTFIAFRQSPWHHYGVLMLEQTQVGVRTPFLDNDVVKTVYRAPRSVLVNEEARLRLIREGSAALGNVRTDRGLGGSSRLASLIRNPYLEFTFKAEYAYDYGMPQSFAKVDHFFARLHLERLWLGRHKVFHFRVWYRDQLANYVREMLLDSRSLARPYLRPERVREIVGGHLKGNRNYTTEINRLLSLELVHRLFVDG